MHASQRVREFACKRAGKASKQVSERTTKQADRQAGDACSSKQVHACPQSERRVSDKIRHAVETALHSIWAHVSLLRSQKSSECVRCRLSISAFRLTCSLVLCSSANVNAVQQPAQPQEAVRKLADAPLPHHRPGQTRQAPAGNQVSAAEDLSSKGSSEAAQADRRAGLEAEHWLSCQSVQAGCTAAVACIAHLQPHWVMRQPQDSSSSTRAPS